ncbi:MAG: hypothetical protein COA63_007010 [Methylophaga sp.]|nr:hypothetical protein [Methylophaga sp.]
MSIESAKPQKSLVKALRWQLRPLIKLLLKSGITFPFLADLLKEIFVEVAENDFKLQNKEQTDSRINFLTGIHRKDVKRLRNSESDNEAPESVSLGAQLAAKWIGSNKFLDENQKPLPLPRLIKQGGEQSFEALVISVNKDIRSRAVLDEWLSLGIVSIDDQDRIFLNASAFIPEQGYDEKAWFFGENIHDHIAAGAHNMLGEQPPFLDRAVFYDQLSQHSINELQAMAEKSGMTLLRKINRHALELQAVDKLERQVNSKKAEDEAPSRMRFGIYFYNEAEQSSEANKND